jgi:hypothetical protein
MDLGGEEGDQRFPPSSPAVIKTCDAGGLNFRGLQFGIDSTPMLADFCLLSRKL